jgi:hypothetical protein
MSLSRILIYASLILMSGFSFFMFWNNMLDIKSYSLDKSKNIIGRLDSFEKENWSGGISFNLKLMGFTNYFSVPTPEWKSFDFENFSKTVTRGDIILLSIPNTSMESSKIINVFQITSHGRNFIDFEKMKTQRKLNMNLALLFGILCLIGIVHHHYKPWKL